ncbi:MAG: hypothetical protein AAFX76_11550, partial [Planctomycetota bacterium]
MLKLFTTPRRENDPSPPAPPEPGDVPGGMPGGVLPGWLGAVARARAAGGTSGSGIFAAAVEARS